LQQRFLVRKAVSRDLELLVRHRRGMWIDLGFREKGTLHEADRVYRKWAKSGFKNISLLGWVAETRDGAEIASGCIWLRAAQPRPNLKKQVQPYLLSLYTEPPFRRKGVAFLVVKEAIKWCKRNGYSRLALHASRKGRGLYRKLGFSRTWEMRLNLQRKTSQ
jgi:GNAT superfamily N-acetyltransferase